MKLEEHLKSIGTSLLALVLLLSVSIVQSAPARPGHPAPPVARTDVYHVHFAKAALGKSAQLGDFLKTPNPNDPMGTHKLVLRHQDGDAWDYVVIQHLGTKATVEAAGTPVPAAARDLGDWHTDTFVNGPSWPEFTKAMGIDESAAKTGGSVYVVSVYRAAPGHRDELEKQLGQAPPTDGSDTSSGNVLMQHLEGGPWQYLTIARYNSWQDFATNESNAVAQEAKGTGGWFELRSHESFHNDTLTVRIAP
jgi:hypothetical protein